MFTGIIEATGRVTRREPRGGDLHLGIVAPDLDASDVALGDSIAVSGCCLTVVAHEGDTLAFDISNESLALTTLGDLGIGDRVNLEKALRLADRLGGHLVSGVFARQEDHADAVFAGWRQAHALPRHLLAVQPVGNLDQDAGAVAHQRIGAHRAAMIEVAQDRQALLDDRVIPAALDVRDETHAAGIVFVTGVVQTLCMQGRHRRRSVGARFDYSAVQQKGNRFLRPDVWTSK